MGRIVGAVRLCSVLLVSLFITVHSAFALETKARQLAAMEAVLAELEVHYGMAEFKRQMFGVTIDGLRTKYSRLITEAKTLEEDAGLEPSVKREILPPSEFRQLMIGMIAELRDGHVSLYRLSHDGWTLGLVTAMIDGHLYVTGKNPDLLVSRSASRDIHIGDEILTINGVAVAELAKKEILYSQYATYETRLMDAMEKLLFRHNSMQRPVTEGEEVTLELKHGSDTYKAHLNWIGFRQYMETRARYSKHFELSRTKAWSEEVPVPFGVAGTVSSYFRRGLMEKVKLGSLQPGSILDIGKLLNVELSERAAKAGAQAEETRPQGELSEVAGGIESTASGEPTPKKTTPVQRLQAYLIRHEGKNIGVLRVPSYSGDIFNEIRWIGEALSRLENMADVLVLDVLSNTGGSVYYGTRLLSMLAGEQSLHSIRANTRLTETLLYIHGQPGEPKEYGTGRRLNYAEDRVQQLEYEAWVKKFESGERWTGLEPSFANVTTRSGAGVIVPDDGAKFTKPILILNDSRSASGGDFVPAILQANKRGIVQGDTSKGLGGPVYRSIDSMPGSEMGFRCTMAYCERSDGLPIENMGVVPNVSRPIEISDVRGQGDGRGAFSVYVDDTLAVAVALADKKSESEIRELMAERVAKRNKNEDRDKEMEPLKSFLSGYATSPEFVQAEEDLFKHGAAYISDLTKSVDQMLELGKSMKPQDWKLVKVPLPKTLVKEDQILATLWKRDEVLARFNELEKVESWKSRPELLEVARAVRREIGRLPEFVRLGDPCSLWLTAETETK